MKGQYKNLRRPDNPENGLDFEVELPDGKHVFLDHKGMIDFKRLAKEKGINVDNFPSHESVAFNMGKDSVKQKSQHIPKNDDGMLVSKPGFPSSPSDVVHLFNFGNIEDRSEIPKLVQAVINGAEQEGYTDGILFLMD